jgi:asparagine synthase (glutamine-hydrolysing)
VAAAAHLRGGAADFDTFTFASGDAHDESAIAAKVAAEVGCRNYSLSLRGADFVECLERATLAQDEPIVGPSILAQYKLFEFVRAKGTRVVLDGQGGDELMAGYPWYLGAGMASSLRRGRLGSAAGLLRTWASQGGNAGAFSSLARFAVPSKYHWPIRRTFGIAGVERWMNQPWFKERQITEELAWHCPSGDPLASVRMMDLRTNLPQLLRFEDRNSMAHSVESRVPFLTVPMARLALSMPSDFLISGAATYKHVFKLAMDGLVPDYVVKRTDKIGFRTPEAHLLIENRVNLLKQLANGNPLLDGPLSRSALKNSLNDSALSAKATHQLWRVMAALEWIRCFNLSVT